MNKPMPPTPLRQEDYLAIESAVMETARGRWFLSEYARRNRNADTDTLLGAIDKLEKSIVRERSPSTVMERVKMDLADMAAAIEKTKKEIAQIKHEDNDGSERFERASNELDAIVSQTESATGDILGAAEKIQEYAWTLREAGADEENCNHLDAEATNIYMACSFQDLTGQRIRKIVEAMRYVESRINSMIDIWGFEANGVEIDENHARSHDTRADAHLLNGPALEGEGVEQDDVDVLLNQHNETLESNQDDVDALFGGGGFDAIGDDADVIEGEFDKISAPSEEVDFEAASVEPEAPVEEVEATADQSSEDAFVDMNDLDWAADTAREKAEAPDQVAAIEAELDLPEVDVSVEAQSRAFEMAAADVFASTPARDLADEDSAEQTDVFVSVDDDADVFASASDEDEDLTDETAPMDLVSRVADFS